jgi:hypothetical protein
MEASKDEPEDVATEDEDTSGLETTAAESCIDDNDIDGSLAALFRAEASTNKQMAIDKENPGAQNPLQCDPMLFNLLVAVARSAMTTFRFGKHVDVSFTKLGKLSGASIETHLLEKVRLIHPSPGERNHNVLCQFLKSATARERQEFFIGNKSHQDFRVLSESGAFDRRNGVNDEDNHFENVGRCGELHHIKHAGITLWTHDA